MNTYTLPKNTTTRKFIYWTYIYFITKENF